MFKCAITGKFSKPGTKAIRLITAKRERFYFPQKADGSEDFECGEPIGHGWEIESEVNVTLEGLGIWVVNNPDDLESAERYNQLLATEVRQKLQARREGAREETN